MSDIEILVYMYDTMDLTVLIVFALLFFKYFLPKCTKNCDCHINKYSN